MTFARGCLCISVRDMCALKGPLRPADRIIAATLIFGRMSVPRWMAGSTLLWSDNAMTDATSSLRPASASLILRAQKLEYGADVSERFSA
jgi:hypothetical protein